MPDSFLSNSVMDQDKIFPSSKKVNIGVTSSLLDLKAELMKRKNAAASVTKTPSNESSCQSSSNTTAKSKWLVKADELEARGELDKIKPSRKKKGGVVGDKQKKKTEEDVILEESLRKSREALERKSRLYEERYSQAKEGLTIDSSDEDDESSSCLVNFVQKAYMQHLLPSKSTETMSESDDDEVEFTDSFGRTRKCLKKDLPQVKRLDKEAKTIVEEKKAAEKTDMSEEDDEEIIGPMPPVEEDVPVGPIHYQDLAHNEVREHGVGYFQFSSDEAVRKEQRRMLDELREQTRREREKAKEKKRQMKRERLKKIAEEKGIQFNPEEVSDSSSDEETQNFPVETEIDRRHEEVVSRKEDMPRKWDEGKKDESGKIVRKPAPSVSSTSSLNINDTDSHYISPLDKKYLQTKRKERIPEFGPPSSYFSSEGQGSKRSQEVKNLPASKKLKPPQDPTDIEKIISEKLAFFKHSQT